MGWNQDVARIIRFIPEFEKKEAAISAALIESRKLVLELNKITEGHGVIDINGKKYLDKSEVEKMIADFASKQDVKKLEESTSKLIDGKTKNLATKLEVKKSNSDLSEKIKESTSNLVDNEKLKLLTKDVSERLGGKISKLSDDINSVKSVDHLSMLDVNEALKPYELTKDVNGKIKSCRDTMGESYDLYTKSLDKKLSSIESGVSEFKKSQSLAYDKLEKETNKSIVETGQKLEKSILKKVLDKISKLMG